MARISYRYHHFPAPIIRHAVWLYVRFTLSYRDVEDLVAERGINVSYETVRRWVLKFGPAFARQLRQQRLQPSARTSISSWPALRISRPQPDAMSSGTDLRQRALTLCQTQNNGAIMIPRPASLCLALSTLAAIGACSSGTPATHAASAPAGS